MTIIMGFDPVTESEIIFLKCYRKKNSSGTLTVSVSEEGVLDRNMRLYLLERALRPYRRILVSSEAKGEVITGFEKDEEQVRSGKFYLAAKGIRGILAESSLYLDEITDAMCTPARASHSRSTALTAASLALRHGISPEQAYKAGMLHDITKKWPKEEAEKYLASEPEILKLNPNMWHSYTAARWIRENMGITDRTFLNALRHHTVGDGKTKLDHILYIADKTEPGRAYDCEAELQLAFKDLKKAAALVKEEAIQYILDKEGINVGNT